MGRRMATIPGAALSIIFAATGCGGQGSGGVSQSRSKASGPPPPPAVAITLPEDSIARSVLAAAPVDGKPVTFEVVGKPGNGTLTIDAISGALTYVPYADFNGRDTASYAVRDGESTSAPSTISLTVEPVDDAPAIAPLSDALNSAEQRETVVQLKVIDVDREPYTLTASTDDPAVASVSIDTVGDAVRLVSLREGSTLVVVTISDGRLSTEQSMRFTVAPVTKHREWQLGDGSTHAVSIRNSSDRMVSFDWAHSGMKVASNRQGVLADVVSSADGLPLELKLWRYLADNVYHWYPTTEAFWIHDPVVLVNSVGFGFCDDLASAMALLAREAGLDSRVWWLSGHVVPEVLIGTNWMMLDPDLAVYYKKADGSIAGVADLAADPSLITAPNAPVLPTTASAYWQEIADFFSTTDDNVMDDYELDGPDQLQGTIELPAGARITYPGQWSSGLIGAEGARTYPAPAFAQLRLDLPAGFDGDIRLPFVLWDATGSGQVTVADELFEAGSTALVQRLQSWESLPTGIQVHAVSDVSLVFLVNPMRFGMQPVTSVDLTATDVWALDVQLATLDSANQLVQSLDALRRP